MAPANNSKVHDLIEKMLAEREQMLVLFCKLAGLAPFTHDKPIHEELDDFSEILIDYISVGHFEAYDQIFNVECPRHQDVMKLAEQHYPRILRTTDKAVDFNDKYDVDNETPIPHTQLESDLTGLISEIVVRIDLEDKLISAMRAQ